MVIMPLTIRQAFIAVIFSVRQLCVVVWCDLCRYFATYNRGYESKNHIWHSDSQEPPKAPQK